CRDCTGAHILCHSCLRGIHLDNPLHRIEVWTGKYFCPVEMWEVGAYILIPHHLGPPLCATLKVHIEMLERFQTQNDTREQ
ncbi:hypothetical protein BYT27DRAFT_7056354, partial [Phlegmacium glaucopus]